MLAFVLLTAVAAAPANSALTDTLDHWLVAAGFKGSVLVAQGGNVVLRKGYGMADRENNIPYEIPSETVSLPSLGRATRIDPSVPSATISADL